MATLTKSFGTVAENTGLGNQTWNNPTNAETDDSNFAMSDVSGSGSENSYILDFTNMGITAGELPDSSTINGIQFRYKRNAEDASSDGVVELLVQLIIAGTRTGDDKADTVTEWLKNDSGTTETITKGGTSDLWGTSITAANLRDNTTGVAFQCNRAGSSAINRNARVFYGEMIITYTAAGGGPVNKDNFFHLF